MQSLLLDLCARYRPAVLLITHDVNEAIHLADRLFALDEDRFVVDETIALPNDRGQRELRFAQVWAQLFASLGVKASELRQVA